MADPAVRQGIAHGVLLKLLEGAKRPNSLKPEDVDRWADGLASLSVAAADSLLDFLHAPARVTTADMNKTVREAQAPLLEEIDEWKRRAEAAEEDLRALKRENQ